MQKSPVSLNYIEPATYKFKTIEEGKLIIEKLISQLPFRDEFEGGLLELIINAIEHGNLGITFEEKTKLLEQDCWHDEINRRIALPENKGKHVQLTFSKIISNTEGKTTIVFLIKDKGDGFDWKKYMSLSPDLLCCHGRGIAIAKWNFDHLEYNQKGNEVEVSLEIKT